MVGSERLRSKFIDFFVDKGHVEVPSAGLVPPDPTIMFTIAGMVQFKPYFLGIEQPPWPRATTVQRCFRTLDIEVVGTTARHCTFFEMLGNFSFGDYFKEGAIGYAWEFVTEVLGIDPERLWVTVYQDDEEAEQLWKESAGVRPDRIQRMGEDNFWKMGDTGPCGPSSEIYFDRGAEYGESGGPARSDGDRYIEIWNLVFMGMERTADGELRDLPRRNIDTGAGLERILPIVEGVESMFDTDLFVPLLDRAQSLTGVRYGRDDRSTRSLRVMADHARAMVCLIADGVTPSNEGRGSVLRRVVRRAILRAFQLGAMDQVCKELGDVAIDSLSSALPKLGTSRDSILETIDREETTFRRTLERGNAILEQELSSGKGISGHTAFTLHDTYGFPIELTAEIAESEGVSVDMDGFAGEMEAQKDRARRAFSSGRAASDDGNRNDLYTKILEDSGPTEFLGYETEESSATVLAIVQAQEPGEYEIVLDRTPFYAESGGQLGDTGRFLAMNETDGEQPGRESAPFIAVLDTQAVPGGVITHRVTIPEDKRVQGSSRVSDAIELGSGLLVRPGDQIYAMVNHDRRASLRRNHTATHLLHAALRQVLGDHVHQQGSLVATDRLRFDFSHHSHIEPEELENILEMANSDVVSDSKVSTIVTGRAEAESMGALAFFGDRYGNEVRVVRAGEHSTEFCGGTHVSALGQIGPILVVSESSIGSNTRRLEAITGLDSTRFLVQRSQLVESAARTLNVEPEQLLYGVERLLEQKQSADKELERRKKESLDSMASDLVRDSSGDTLVARVDGISNDELRDVATKVRARGVKAVILVGSPDGEKVAVAIATDGSKNAGELIKELAGIVKGGGGGSPQMAMAGGKDVSGIDELIRQAWMLVGNGAV